MTGWESSAHGADPTGQGLSAEDVDLLADFVGGALDGTARYADVAERIRRDPAWRRAHAVLIESTVAVATDLRAWAAVAEPMPDAVADRLTAAVADAGGIAGAAGVAGAATPVRPTRAVAVTPRRRRRWVSWAGPLAAAAAVATFAGLGLAAIPGMVDDEHATTTGAPADAGDLGVPAQGPQDDGRRQVDKSPRGPADAPARVLVASGRDYAPGTVGTAGTLMVAPDGASGPDQGGGAVPRAPEQAGPVTGDGADTDDGPAGVVPTLPGGDPMAGVDAGRVDPALRRLVSEAALADCVAAIGSEHPRPVDDVALVDYAAFESRPALVVVFTDVAGQRWAWAVGPGCGTVSSGADSRYRANIGW